MVAALAFLVLASPAAAREADSSFSGPARVVDGDTLVVTHDGAERTVRIFGIDAPESKQSCTRDRRAWACGVQSTEELRAYIGSRTVHCVTRNTDRYGRDVALCDVGGQDIGAWQVTHGWALAYRQYGGSVYNSAETKARREKRGVWASGVSLQPPWEWRADRRDEQKERRGNRG